MTTRVKALEWGTRRDLAAAKLTVWEGRIAGTMRRYFNRQRTVALARLHGKQGRYGTRHAHGDWHGAKQVDPQRLLDPIRWDQELRSVLSGLFSSLTQDVGNELFDAFQLDGVFNLHNPRVTEALTRRVTKITRTNDTTMDAIRRQLIEGENAGETIRQLAQRVNAVFDDASYQRSETIARTETNGALNEGGFLAADQSQLDLTKTWLASNDNRTRESHAEADGQEVAFDEPFIVGGWPLDFPGDAEGPPEEVINCRCTAVYTPQGGDEITVEADEGF